MLVTGGGTGIGRACAARLAAFLISGESRWITGTAINVDGGHSLRRGPDFGSFLPYSDDVKSGRARP